MNRLFHHCVGFLNKLKCSFNHKTYSQLVLTLSSFGQFVGKENLRVHLDDPVKPSAKMTLNFDTVVRKCGELFHLLKVHNQVNRVKDR